MSRKVAAQQQLQLEDVPIEEPAMPRSRRQDEDQRRPATAARRPAAAELLETQGALLTRTHLRDLGLERRAVDAVFRMLPVVALPGYSRPMIRADQYLALVDECTYRDDRVRPAHA